MNNKEIVLRSDCVLYFLHVYSTTAPMPRSGRDCRLGRGSPGSLPSDRTRWALSPGFCRVLGGRPSERLRTKSLQPRLNGQSGTGSSTVSRPGSHDVEPALDPNAG